MRSNSKLSKAARAELVTMSASFADTNGFVFSFPKCGATVAIRPAGNNIEGYFASVSVADGKTEKKFRPEVGEFLALARALNGEGIFISADSVKTYSVDSYKKAESLAELCGNYGDWGGNPDREEDSGQLEFLPEVWREMKRADKAAAAEIDYSRD